MTKDRVGAGLAVLAAIVGLVLVFSFPQSEGGEEDDEAPGAETSEVVEAPGPPAPGQLAPGPDGEQPGDDDDG